MQCQLYLHLYVCMMYDVRSVSCRQPTTVWCSGGRDHDGCPILKLTQPKTVNEAMLKEVKEEGIMDMLIYFTSVPRSVVWKMYSRGISHYSWF